MSIFLSILSGAAVAGAGAALGSYVTRWLGRERLSLSLLSIAREVTQPGTGLSVPPSVVEWTRSFHWGMGLQPFSDPDRIDEEIRACRRFTDESPDAKSILSILATQTSRASTHTDRLTVVQELIKKPVIMSIMADGLYRKKIQIGENGTQGRISRLIPDKRQGELLQYDVKPKGDDRIEINYLIDHETGGWDLSGGQATRKLEAMQHLLIALQRFNKGAIKACLKYAQETIDEDFFRASAIEPQLKQSIALGPLQINAIVTNRGNQIGIVNRYAILYAEGGASRLEPILLKIDTPERADRDDEKHDYRYISLDPHSTKRLVMTSDTAEGDAEQVEQLRKVKAAYETGILKCRISAIEQKTRNRQRRLWSPPKRFGAGLVEDLKAAAKDPTVRPSLYRLSRSPLYRLFRYRRI